MSYYVTDESENKRWFNKDKLKTVLKAYESSRTIDSLQKEIAKRVHSSEETVRGWLYKNHSPNHIEAIYVIEELLNLKKGDLLLDYDPEEKVMTNIENTSISAEERVAAAKLYSLMYDMILAFDNNLPEVNDPIDEFFFYHMEWIEKAKYSFAHQEEFRYKCLVDIRKNAIWFPKSMIDSLEELVNKEFGPVDYDYHEMAYGSDEYKKYLKKNKLKNTSEARDLFATAFRRELFEDLNRIFDKYLVK